MVSGDHSEGRDQINVGLVIGLGVFESLKVQDHREQSDAVEVNSLLGKVAGNARSAGGAVALTQQEERRVPALVARNVHADELAESLDIAFYTPEFFRRVQVFSAAEAGADGVHHDQIALIEQRVWVVLNVIWSHGKKTIC